MDPTISLAFYTSGHLPPSATARLQQIERGLRRATKVETVHVLEGYHKAITEEWFDYLEGF